MDDGNTQRQTACAPAVCVNRDPLYGGMGELSKRFVCIIIIDMRQRRHRFA